MVKTAATLGRGDGRGKRLARGRPILPRLWFVTDPDRTPDPSAVIARLPKGAGVIYRGFGVADAPAVAAHLRRLTRARGLILLIGADPGLAARVGADGVHLPERMMGLTGRLRTRQSQWMITVAAHSPRALARAGRLGLDAALVSVVFESRSPSAGRPMGPARLAALARGARTPVIALGGVNDQTAPRLIGTRVWGLAAVAGFGG